MPRITAEEKKLAETIKRLPFNDEDKDRWSETITNDGLSEEMVQEIQTAMAALPRDDEAQNLRITRASMEMNNLVRRWRLGQNLRNRR